MKRDRVLGIVGCLALVDELVEVLSKDEGIERAFIIESEEGRMAAHKLRRSAPYLDISMMNKNRLKLPAWHPGLSVIVWMCPSNLHEDAETIRSNLRRIAITLENSVDSILMFYGLCRRTSGEIERLINEIDVPVTFLTDLEGEVVDDCFAAILGGRKAYLDTIRKCKGTLFLTTGYAEHWSQLQEGKDLVRLMEEINGYQFLFKSLGYTKLLKLDTGLGDMEEFDIRAHNLSRIFDFSLEKISCDLRVFWHSYELAKEKLEEMTGEEQAAEIAGAMEQNDD